jgi:hypothetical protein
MGRGNYSLMPAMKSSRLTTWGFYALVLMTACLDTASKTDLYPQLPPMLFQVRGEQAFVGSQGNVIDTEVFAFGTNPNATATDTPNPSTLTMAAVKQHFRLIMSDLLVGNYIENIECRDGTYQFVPVDATPDDVAKCAVSQDVLPLLCTGENAMCFCQTQTGCEAQQINAPPILVPFGSAVGVMDQNQDGAADASQFRAGAVQIICTGIVSHLVHNVPLNPGGANDPDGSYWDPSGDQQEPAEGDPSPFDFLGPAIVIVPQDFGTGGNVISAIMPTSSKCTFKFSPEVVDKKGEQPCAPSGGFGGSGVNVFDLHCTPDDFSAADFVTEPLFFNNLQYAPLSPTIQGGPLTQGETIPRASVISFATSDSMPMDANSIFNVQLLEGSAVYTQFTYMLAPDQTSLQLIPTGSAGLDGSATYTLVVPATVTDTFGEPNVQPINLTFTTGP